MKKRLAQLVPAVLALVGIVSARASYWCMYTTGTCYGTWVSHIYQYVTNPLYNFALYFLPAAVLLIFVPRDAFKSWLKFAVWALPLALISIAMTPVNWTGIGIDLYPFYRDDAARLAGGLVSGLTLILVLLSWIQAWRARRNRTSAAR
jgi:hypothetical protein